MIVYPLKRSKGYDNNRVLASQIYDLYFSKKKTLDDMKSRIVKILKDN